MLAKFWRALGFGSVAPIQIPENPALPYCYGFQLVMPISFANAVRALVSRRMHIGVASLTDVEINVAESAVVISVLAPGNRGSQP